MKNLPKAFNFKIWIFYYLLCISLVLLSACGSGGGGDGDDTSETSSSGTGSVSFKLALQNSGTIRALNNQQLNDENSQFECQTDEYLIATIEARVSNENDELLAKGGPFDCEDRKGSISDVEAGDGRIVEVLAKDGSGETIFDGKSERFSLEPRQTKDLGRIIIKPVNSAPVLNPIGDQFVNENQLLEFDLEATDPDNDDLSFSIDNLPPGASFVDNGDGVATFSWRPAFDMAGEYDVTITVSDDGVPSLSDSETISITVVDFNRPPMLAPIGSKEVEEGQLLEFIISATDPDGDGLSFSIGNRPTGASFVDNGNGTATFSWIPDFEASSNYQVNFTVTDDSTQAPGMLSDFEEVTITVGDVCRPPVLAPIGPKAADEDQLLEFTITAADPDVEDILSFSIGNRPIGANFVDNQDNTATFNWTPGFEDAGNYPVIFTVTDDCPPPEGPLSDFEEVTITVGDVCRPPVLTPIGPQITEEGQLLEFTITATDPDIGDTLTFSCESADLDCDSVFDPNTQTFSWTPGFEDAGNYTVRFTVSDDCPDPGPQRDFEEVTITVGDVCRPPVLSPIGDQSTDEGKLLEFTITATDPDIGDTLTFSCDSEHFEGTFCDLFNPNTQRFSWTPGFFAAGMYDVGFTVTDSCPPPDGPLSDFEDITITVVDVCRPPVLDRIGPQSVKVNEELRFKLAATDPDGDALSFSCVSEDIDCEEYFNASTQTFNWTPGYLDLGSYTVRFIVTDACDDPGPRRDFEDVNIVVDPECEGTTCGKFENCCVVGGEPIFSGCATIVEGGGVCTTNISCEGLQPCESSNDCDNGGLCVRDTCCAESIKVCLPPEVWCVNITESNSEAIQATDEGPTIYGR